MPSKDKNIIAGSLLIALVKAFKNPTRTAIREEGLDERDLAFEADLLSPMDMELVKYASTKRRSIVNILEQLEIQGLIRFKDKSPGILYKIFPTENGMTIGEKLMRPWFMNIFHSIFPRSK